MERTMTMNPFAKRDGHDKLSIIIYRVLTLATWLAVAAIGIVFSIRKATPSDAKTIWDQNDAFPTHFSLHRWTATVYGALLLLLQPAFIYFLYTNNEDLVNAAANVGSHFIVSNVMFVAWILFWVYEWFWIAEIPIILNFFNLTSLYFRHRRAPPFVHVPVVSGPLALNFVMLFWTGAAAINVHNVVARVFANSFVWAILFYGLFFTVAFKDYAMGYALSLLSLSLAIQQHATRDVAETHGPHLQWVFAFIITALLFTITVTFSAPPVLLGKELVFAQLDDAEDEDLEHRPLLDHE
ncbi:hypothetical protein MMC21_005107 [Puttea exsequens]|nr:hypothetical protein [Puttea exsequens]